MFSYKVAGLLYEGVAVEEFICVSGGGPDVTIRSEPKRAGKEVEVKRSEVESFVDVSIRGELTLENALAVLAFVNKTSPDRIEIEEGAVVSV